MLKQKAEEWAKKLRSEIEGKKKERASLEKEMEEFNFKIGVLEIVQEETWTEIEQADDVVKICNDEITRLKKERNEKNNAIFNLEAEIEHRRRIIETLKKSPYRTEEN